MPKKDNAKKPDDDAAVKEYMDRLVHPLKKEIEAVRKIIKSADSRISERIKWNAPSYYYKDDIVTFNHREQKRVHLVFHHKEIVNIPSALLEGDYKDRRMMYLKNMEEVKEHEDELKSIMSKMVAFMDSNT